MQSMPRYNGTDTQIGRTMEQLQVINISDEQALCTGCGSDLLDIINFQYDGQTITTPTCSEEMCSCKKCKTKFLIRYDLFDQEGHINQRVFTGDINNNDYNWQDNLSEEQKGAISKHLKECKTCQDRLEDETLKDAWFSSIIHNNK